MVFTMAPSHKKLNAILNNEDTIYRYNPSDLLIISIVNMKIFTMAPGHKIECNRSQNHTEYNAIVTNKSQMYCNNISHVSIDYLILQPHIAKQHFLQWKWKRKLAYRDEQIYS